MLIKQPGTQASIREQEGTLPLGLTFWLAETTVGQVFQLVRGKSTSARAQAGCFGLPGTQAPPEWWGRSGSGDVARVARRQPRVTTAQLSSGGGVGRAPATFQGPRKLPQPEAEPYITQPCLPLPAFKQIPEAVTAELSGWGPWKEGASLSAASAPEVLPSSAQRAARRALDPYLSPGLFPCILAQRRCEAEAVVTAGEGISSVIPRLWNNSGSHCPGSAPLAGPWRNACLERSPSSVPVATYLPSTRSWQHHHPFRALHQSTCGALQTKQSRLKSRLCLDPGIGFC
ncbi:hypothetical protein GH733_013716, partial [Mirounga leonina]